jgi:FSR family fosmidomycin resistance protein-like MFS transporter
VLVFFLAPIVVALFFGRTFCAAVCPQGAIQDLVLVKPLKVPLWLEHGLGVIPFLFLGAGAVGTLAGGPVGDRIGRKQVIWLSILGIAPFALILPHANLLWTALLSMFIGAIMASAFPAILVYATELMPGKVGLIAGLFFGLPFGLAGIGSAVLGKLADATSIEFVMSACSFLPLIGLLTWFLPDLRKAKTE